MRDARPRSSFSPARIDRMRQTLEGYIERGTLPGLVALVARGDDVRTMALGTLAFDDPAPMRRDTIFRIASLSKPVTAAAAMILVEECTLRLHEPIERWLPEFANRRVLRSIESELDDTVPAERSITAWDLLTSTMGIGSVMAMPDTYPIQRAIRELRIGGDGPALPTRAPTMDRWLSDLASLPSIAQPGKRWMYHVSSDLLGALVARASGRSLGTFMRERIFEPLGMRDTGFRVPAESIARLPAFYFFDGDLGKLGSFDDRANSAWLAEPPFESGGGGLVSTVDDFYAFDRMLLNGGRLGDRRVLSRAAVDLMTSDRLSPEQREGAEIFFGRSSSWGFGMSVDIAGEEIFHRPGRFGWAGGFGTTAYADPANDMVGALFTQRMMDSPEPPTVFDDFWTLAYAALDGV